MLGGPTSRRTVSGAFFSSHPERRSNWDFRDSVSELMSLWELLGLAVDVLNCSIVSSLLFAAVTWVFMDDITGACI